MVRGDRSEFLDSAAAANMLNEIINTKDPASNLTLYQSNLIIIRPNFCLLVFWMLRYENETCEIQNRISGWWEWARTCKGYLSKHCYCRCNTEHTSSLSYRSSRADNGRLGLVCVSKHQRCWINYFLLKLKNPLRPYKWQQLHLAHQKALLEQLVTHGFNFSPKSPLAWGEYEMTKHPLPHVCLKYSTTSSGHQWFQEYRHWSQSLNTPVAARQDCHFFVEFLRVFFPSFSMDSQGRN